jgi:hypothetical protein
MLNSSGKTTIYQELKYAGFKLLQRLIRNALPYKNNVVEFGRFKDVSEDHTLYIGGVQA